MKNQLLLWTAILFGALSVAGENAIEKIDANFRAAPVNGTEYHFYDVNSEPFEIEGFPFRAPGEKGFRRLPADFTEQDINAGALKLNTHTPGGAIRFKTNSSRIALRAKLLDATDMSHMPRAGSAGFDLYQKINGQFIHIKTFQPSPVEVKGEKDFLRLAVTLKSAPVNEFLLNMPLYGGAEKIEIGLLPGSKTAGPEPRKIKDPILFYGSSITQGACASRPGNMYPSRLCRVLDAPQVNLGFSGGAKGEPAVARAIASLKLTAFVYDYDHNANNEKHLSDTHEAFFKIIRAAQPELPVIILSRCDIWPEKGNAASDLRRRDIIRRTYENAVAAGDRNVYFIDGTELFGDDGRLDCTVDCVHPNDQGFYRMYRTVLPVLRKALKL